MRLWALTIFRFDDAFLNSSPLAAKGFPPDDVGVPADAPKENAEDVCSPPKMLFPEGAGAAVDPKRPPVGVPGG